MLLQSDTALVTGTGGGIGLAIAQALEEEGAKVLRADLKDADLSQPGAAHALAARAIRELGAVSIFVHAASPPRRENQTALAVTEAEWRAMLEVNLNSGFLLAQALGRHMRERKIRGRMLFVTSLHADSPRNLPHYSASKAGQTMVMKELARALGPARHPRQRHRAGRGAWGGLQGLARPRRTGSPSGASVRRRTSRRWRWRSCRRSTAPT